MSSPPSLTLSRAAYTLTPALLDNLACEYLGKVLEGGMVGAGRDEEDEVVIEFETIGHMWGMREALKCYMKRD